MFEPPQAASLPRVPLATEYRRGARRAPVSKPPGPCRAPGAFYANAKHANAKHANAKHANAKHANAKHANAKHANAKHANANKLIEPAPAPTNHHESRPLAE